MNLRHVLCKIFGCHGKETFYLKQELDVKMRENLRASAQGRKTAGELKKEIEGAAGDPIRQIGRLMAMRRKYNHDDN